jgi:hypothetical protein
MPVQPQRRPDAVGRYRAALHQLQGMPMEEIKIPKVELIPAFNNLTALARWLRPGGLNFTVSLLAEACQQQAVALSTNRAKLLDEAAKKDEKGNHVTEDRNGQKVTLFRSAKAGEEFRQREQELFEGEVTIPVERKLTLADIDKIDTERLKDTPKDDAGREISVDMSAIRRFIALESDGADKSVRPLRPRPKAAAGGKKR